MSPRLSTRQLRRVRRIAVTILSCISLGACGISPDFRPRDIDPEKQELLLPSITPITTSESTNP